jgi:hypothetical protein
VAKRETDIATVEKILNHSGGSFAGIAGVYQTHAFANEKRRTLELWRRTSGR